MLEFSTILIENRTQNHTSNFVNSALIKEVIKKSQTRHNKTSNVRITQYSGAFLQPLLQWKSTKYYIYRVRVFVILGIQHSMRMHNIYLWIILLYCILPRYLKNGTIDEETLSSVTCVSLSPLLI